MGEWSEISTAPSDLDTIVDVWAVDRRTGKGWRVTDCTRSRDGCWLHDGRWFTGKHYYDKYGDEVYDRTATDEKSVVVTHWMMPPGPPSSGGVR